MAMFSMSVDGCMLATMHGRFLESGLHAASREGKAKCVAPVRGKPSLVPRVNVAVGCW